MIRRAVILAGGLGRRLAPYTFVIPKPIVPIGTTPIVEIVLRQLARDGVEHVTIALGHMSEIVRAVAGDGSKFGLRLDYSEEPKPLGTMGPLRLIPDLGERFFVLNADLLTDLDFGALARFHDAHGGPATVATYVKTTKLELGVIETDETSRIVAFREKPTFRHKVSMGIYAFDRSVLDLIPEGRAFGFDGLMAALLAADRPIRSFLFDGQWLDIGIPADYQAAQEEFEQHPERYLPADRAKSPRA